MFGDSSGRRVVHCTAQAASGWRAVRSAYAGARSTVELDGKTLREGMLKDQRVFAANM
jgi:hypothetical protein